MSDKLIVPLGSVPQTVTVVKRNHNYLILIYNCVIVIHCYVEWVMVIWGIVIIVIGY